MYFNFGSGAPLWALSVVAIHAHQQVGVLTALQTSQVLKSGNRHQTRFLIIAFRIQLEFVSFALTKRVVSSCRSFDETLVSYLSVCPSVVVVVTVRIQLGLYTTGAEL